MHEPRTLRGRTGAIPSRTLDISAIEVRRYPGDRSALRALFEEAEDSAEQLDSYQQLGDVLVAVQDGVAVGHLQLIETAAQGEVELKRRMVVPTAAADIGNLRFYQRCRLRVEAVERDAFIPETGYPDPIEIDGIPLRDRVWLSQALARSPK
ncbi:MAG TPA: hypothetical protein VHX15_02470 [Frankiaceae bacterium]|jgi:hypothetical protein|nr:hypothetical protein [Frankiaceae bacterium]